MGESVLYMLGLQLTLVSLHSTLQTVLLLYVSKRYELSGYVTHIRISVKYIHFKCVKFNVWLKVKETYRTHTDMLCKCIYNVFTCKNCFLLLYLVSMCTNCNIKFENKITTCIHKLEPLLNRTFCRSRRSFQGVGYRNYHTYICFVFGMPFFCQVIDNCTSLCVNMLCL